MAIFRKHQNKSFELHGNHMVGVATPGSGAEQVEVWRFTMDPGAATPPHSHDAEEIVVVLKGEGVATLGDRQEPFAEGDTLILPKRVVHQITCTKGPLEGVAAMAVGSSIRSPGGDLMDLPWRQ